MTYVIAYNTVSTHHISDMSTSYKSGISEQLTQWKHHEVYLNYYNEDLLLDILDFTLLFQSTPKSTVLTGN